MSSPLPRDIARQLDRHRTIAVEQLNDIWSRGSRWFQTPMDHPVEPAVVRKPARDLTDLSRHE